MSDFGITARVEGDDCVVQAVNTLEDATAGQLSFLSNPKYTSILSETKASAVVVKDGVELPAGISAIRCDDPYAAITVAIVNIHGYRNHPEWGLSDRATIDPTAKIGANPNIANGVTIGANASIGDNCTLYPGCYVADGVTIGHDCVLYPNVVVYDFCELGNRVTIHSSTVVGQDGLGYAPYNEKWFKIPQTGRTVIGDDVEIGANCAIDRATLGTTQIGSGTKFGNTIVIGHGTKIGPDCMFVGLIGVAGSVNIGKHVTLAGQVGIDGHLTIGDHVRVGGRSGVMSDVEPDLEILGTPAVPSNQAKRSLVALSKLPEYLKRISVLEKEIKKLREKINNEG